MSGYDFDEYAYLEQQLQQPDHSGNHRHKRSRSPSYSRSHSRRHRSHSRDRKHHRRSRSRSPRRHRREQGHDARLAKEADREYKELERATRTIFAYNLNIKADERDLFEFFSAVGKVTDIRLITDRHTRKSKGLAYIEFAKQEDTLSALSLNAKPLLGQAVLIKSAEAEKNIAWEAQQQAKASQNSLSQLNGVGPCKLQVMNLHPDLAERELKPLFDSFGDLDFVQLVRDATGKSMKYANIQYRKTEDAQRALQYWNGKLVAGLPLAVSVAAAGEAALPAIGELLDEEEESGVKLNSQARAHLMSRLASSAGLNQPNTPPGTAGSKALPATSSLSAVMLDQGLLGPASPIPTPCLLLKNMFDPQELADPDTEKEIAQDVLDECSKFGRVLHHFLDRSSKGFVYLKFDQVESAQAASKALHGRWYSGHQIMADFQFAQVYNKHFKL